MYPTLRVLSSYIMFSVLIAISNKHVQTHYHRLEIPYELHSFNHPHKVTKVNIRETVTIIKNFVLQEAN